MELQFKIGCTLSRDDILDEGIEDIIYDDDCVYETTISKCGSRTRIGFEISSNSMKRWLLDSIDCAFEYDDDSTVDITNITARNNTLFFDVNIKVDFLRYDPNVLKDLISCYDGKIKKMNVKGGEDLGSEDSFALSLSPFQDNFREIALLLDDAFTISISCGSPVSTPHELASGHTLNYINITAEFKEDHHKKILAELMEMMNINATPLRTHQEARGKITTEGNSNES